MTPTPPPVDTAEPRGPFSGGYLAGRTPPGGLKPPPATVTRPVSPVPAAECGERHPTNPTVVPCTLAPNHGGNHFSTTGCAGSEVTWPAAEDDAVEKAARIIDAGAFVGPAGFNAPGMAQRRDAVRSQAREVLDAAGVPALRARLAEAEQNEATLREAYAAMGTLVGDVEREARRQVADLRAVALGKVRHVYAGLCPDDVEGWETRDPECPACCILSAALAEGGQPDEGRCYCRHDYHDTDCPEGWPEGEHPAPVLPDSPDALRERVAEALRRHYYHGSRGWRCACGSDAPSLTEHQADAVLAVLHPTRHD